MSAYAWLTSSSACLVISSSSLRRPAAPRFSRFGIASRGESMPYREPWMRSSPLSVGRIASHYTGWPSPLLCLGLYQTLPQPTARQLTRKWPAPWPHSASADEQSHGIQLTVIAPGADGCPFRHSGGWHYGPNSAVARSRCRRPRIPDPACGRAGTAWVNNVCMSGLVPARFGARRLAVVAALVVAVLDLSACARVTNPTITSASLIDLQVLASGRAVRDEAGLGHYRVAHDVLSSAFRRCRRLGAQA
jgi:hypothetical protein